MRPTHPDRARGIVPSAIRHDVETASRWMTPSRAIYQRKRSNGVLGTSLTDPCVAWGRSDSCMHAPRAHRVAARDAASRSVASPTHRLLPPADPWTHLPRWPLDGNVLVSPRRTRRREQLLSDLHVVSAELRVGNCILTTASAWSFELAAHQTASSSAICRSMSCITAAIRAIRT
jgi:hypothetical protein